MNANTSIAFVVFCVAVYVAACDVLRAPRTRALKDRLASEKNRNRFGELRTRLVRQAVERNIDPRSGLFSSFYRSLTALMRNPHEFERAAQLVLTLPAPEQPGAIKPTRAEGEIARDFAKRLDLLCRDYFRLYAASVSMVAARERLERTAQLAQA